MLWIEPWETLAPFLLFIFLDSQLRKSKWKTLQFVLDLYRWNHIQPPSKTKKNVYAFHFLSCFFFSMFIPSQKLIKRDVELLEKLFSWLFSIMTDSRIARCSMQSAKLIFFALFLASISIFLILVALAFRTNLQK